jgi:hypothetical protein
MKLVLVLSVLILLGSCGKYERPFITFKSPEKRLIQNSWRCIKVIDSSGSELETLPFDHIYFSIDGVDSSYNRISNCCANTYNSDHCSGISVSNDTIVDKWTWGYALEGNQNKQIIKLHKTGSFLKVLYVIRLSNKEFVFQDQSFDNATYHYAPL